MSIFSSILEQAKDLEGSDEIENIESTVDENKRTGRKSANADSILASYSNLVSELSADEEGGLGNSKVDDEDNTDDEDSKSSDEIDSELSNDDSNIDWKAVEKAAVEFATKLNSEPDMDIIASMMDKIKTDAKANDTDKAISLIVNMLKSEDYEESVKAKESK